MNLKVFQIVGYKNSGKTTLVCELIKACQAHGLKVASLKHQHHENNEENRLEDINTDTGKHLAAGAMVTGLVGPHLSEVTFLEEPAVEAYVAFYKELNMDVLIVEGFKNGPYPKAILLRSEADFKYLQSLNNIRAVIVPESCPFPKTKLPIFYLEDTEAYMTYILEWMESQL